MRRVREESRDMICRQCQRDPDEYDRALRRLVEERDVARVSLFNIKQRLTRMVSQFVDSNLDDPNDVHDDLGKLEEALHRLASSAEHLQRAVLSSND